MNIDGERSPFVISGAEQWKLTSRMGNGYRMMVWTPEGAAPAAGFPVIYLLDANATFGTMVETVRLLSMGPYQIEPSIVVGIGYETDKPLHTQRRFYDYTVFASDDELPPRKDDSPWPLTGGAEHFLLFIEHELKPLIERIYPVNKSRQTLFGHSLGGLFVLYTLFMKGDAFQNYVAGSPSIWWKNEHIVPYAERLKEAAQVSPLRSSLYIGIGSQEKPHMVRDAKLMYEHLSAADIPGFNVEYHCFEDEGHLSIIAPLIGRALRFAEQRNHG